MWKKKYKGIINLKKNNEVKAIIYSYLLSRRFYPKQLTNEDNLSNKQCKL